MTEKPHSPAASLAAHSSALILDLASSRRASHADRPDVGPPRAVEDGLSGWARRWLRLLDRALSGNVPDRVLSYREVVDYMEANCPAGPGPVRGALLRRQRTGTCELRFI